MLNNGYRMYNFHFKTLISSLGPKQALFQERNILEVIYFDGQNQWWKYQIIFLRFSFFQHSNVLHSSMTCAVCLFLKYQIWLDFFLKGFLRILNWFTYWHMLAVCLRYHCLQLLLHTFFRELFGWTAIPAVCRRAIVVIWTRLLLCFRCKYLNEYLPPFKTETTVETIVYFTHLLAKHCVFHIEKISNISWTPLIFLQHWFRNKLGVGLG
jgi:hypothetical protein